MPQKDDACIATKNARADDHVCAGAVVSVRQLIKGLCCYVKFTAVPYF